jgi:glyoxylase-like metal-dependent hydrolase (beta-lactamase superfamily II)
VTERRKRELGRADRVLPGLWRLRLPLPWPGVPHGNAWAVAAGDGIVLVDTGIHEPGSMRQLELALGQAGLSLDLVRLLVCTHAHSDHYGQAAPIIEATGCELWVHPRLDHMRDFVADPPAAFDRRLDAARRNGVPAEVIEQLAAGRDSRTTGVAAFVEPDRELVPGVEVETDLGAWQVHETPGHAPSHVVLHQPERRLLLSGDHLLGRVSLFYDYSHAPDPVGEFLDSLDVVDGLDIDLILAGHGRPVRGARQLAQANRDLVHERLDNVRAALKDGDKTVFEIVSGILDGGELQPMFVVWAMGETYCYLRYLERRDEVVREADGDGVDRWRLAPAA